MCVWVRESDGGVWLHQTENWNPHYRWIIDKYTKESFQLFPAFLYTAAFLCLRLYLVFLSSALHTSGLQPLRSVSNVSFSIFQFSIRHFLFLSACHFLDAISVTPVLPQRRAAYPDSSLPAGSPGWHHILGCRLDLSEWFSLKGPRGRGFKPVKPWNGLNPSLKHAPVLLGIFAECTLRVHCSWSSVSLPSMPPCYSVCLRRNSEEQVMAFIRYKINCLKLDTVNMGSRAWVAKESSLHPPRQTPRLSSHLDQKTFSTDCVYVWESAYTGTRLRFSKPLPWQSAIWGDVTVLEKNRGHQCRTNKCWLWAGAQGSC